MPDAPAVTPALPWPFGAPGWQLGRDEALRLTTFNSQAGVALAIDGRFRGQDGQPRAINERAVPNTDRTIATQLIGLSDVELLNLQVRATGGAPRIGQCFAVLEIVRGRTGDVQPVATLAQGYVTDTQRLAWPGSAVRSSVDGSGVLRSITGTDPAAGAEWSETVPTNARWRFVAVRVALVTDATVANRVPQVIVDDGTNTLYLIPSHANQTASLTWTYHGFYAGAAGFASGNYIALPFPGDLFLQGGWRIRSSTGSLQAGDNWGAPQLLVEEWIED
jgi:hypothetical protein